MGTTIKWAIVLCPGIITTPNAVLNALDIDQGGFGEEHNFGEIEFMLEN